MVSCCLVKINSSNLFCSMSNDIMSKYTRIWYILFCCLKAKLNATAEDASKIERSLDRVSSELEVKNRELESSDKQLKDTRQRLKARVEECNAFEVSG